MLVPLGDCNISGTINDIDPEDVVKTAGNFTINGLKTFNATTHVKGNVTVDLINGVDIVDLSETVVRGNVPALIWAPTVSYISIFKRSHILLITKVCHCVCGSLN